MLSTY
jgi:hypothetical protein